MALKFLSTHRIALTPLSPIHIGCGETFEPTNYVIDRERVHHKTSAYLGIH